MFTFIEGGVGVMFFFYWSKINFASSRKKKTQFRSCFLIIKLFFIKKSMLEAVSFGTTQDV